MTIAQPRRERKPARRPLPETKTPKRKSVRVSGSKHGTVADPKTEFTDDEWYEMVATAAYFQAESRGFEGGSPEDNWYEAEAELREQLAAAEDTTDPIESVNPIDDDIERTGE